MQNEKERTKLRIAKAQTCLYRAGAMLKGTVNKVVLGEKKKGEGKREAYLLTYKGERNKTRTVYIKKQRVADAKRMITNYQKAKRTLDQLVELNMKLFKMT
ncbi:MAG: hypothetical protein A2268_16945 [Candidatus Raymondbacteria bacterium RifOxyA12_full_50_37]|uniref:Uncharacterized protein n=1 Tax=Candidatus Raymondbacteria bacterium RIFOXYD12_FULL_49_13 TaxID=1817890 RepID=A0A1F7FCS0_UNCRA|nr:MAG: hypothetical protein A2268_16945 [Candidatus Raymondbacteria bacterium RifOxyA12_full_50_37]OGJ86297.1 MAG: hypothetical protein A2248_16545 [Candidatus Raymondbacteria bacterium RIFOXYA2_FULL_49_16]OGJ95835.1 MAG: hypothetical protein A2453_11855 [Candidatus Raymondbacteria bacterium RIFOXYC2_FULL_50_21]OGJ99037.1 MAG: hypothetical protein A2350_17230 [Candidatus Raymondbacteria bacterium RifOxyB12_full_50_8]OGK04401.1 MAG: hypothetical protein A2519_18515 [Candidatus Raymondbacteria b